MSLEYKPRSYYYNPIEKYYSVDTPFYPTNNKPTRVVLKPTMRCPLNCKHCSGRIKEFTNPEQLTIKDYETLMQDLKYLGTQGICISGGEPLLYPELRRLINIAFKRGFAVTLNTNGLLLTQDKISDLVNAGVVGINISIDSPRQEVHDKLRNKNGLLKHIIEVLSGKESYSRPYILNIRMILSKYNYKDLGKMIQLAHELKADVLNIDPIENDSVKKNYLLNVEQIREFLEKIKPALLKQLKKEYFENERLYLLAIKQITEMFDIKFNKADNFSQGIYWPDERVKKKCSIPSSFMIIEGDGSVLPCNCVEYYRQYIIGNMLKTNIKDLWHSKKWERFRTEKMDYCRLCPMDMSMTIFFNERTIRRNIHEKSTSSSSSC